MELIYQDPDIVVAIKPPRVLSTDEPGGMPELVRSALGEICGRCIDWIVWFPVLWCWLEMHRQHRSYPAKFGMVNSIRNILRWFMGIRMRSRDDWSICCNGTSVSARPTW